ncbi:hypothetical protein GQ472_05345 [archaeon]|nr:hypothetical protein [archaeon]
MGTMDRILDVSFEEKENNVLDIVFEYDCEVLRDPDSRVYFYESENEIYSEILRTFIKIKSDIFGDEITPEKLQHQDTTGPFLGFSNTYKKDNFKLAEVFTTDYHGRISCDFHLRNLKNETSLSFAVGVPQYGSLYRVENLELNIGREVNLLPGGCHTVKDEKTSERIIEYIKRNVYAELNIPAANA